MLSTIFEQRIAIEAENVDGRLPLTAALDGRRFGANKRHEAPGVLPCGVNKHWLFAPKVVPLASRTS